MERLRSILFVLALAGGALGGCAMSGFDPSPDLEAGAVASAKADGAFGAREIALGERVTGNAAGEAFQLFALRLDATDEIRVTVTRTSGDLNPAGYLYRGTEIYVRPTEYTVGEAGVSLDYTGLEGGEHHIVVKAYHGEGAGEFELVVECTGGACAGIDPNPVGRQSACIEAAAQCALNDLPRWNGFVGTTRARSIFTGCLAQDADTSCTSACEDDASAICDEIIGQLPRLADQGAECHALLSSCLSSCEDVGGNYDAESLDESAASACWSGYNGNCEEFIWGHESCGGTEYAADSSDACLARCAATEGAWDEGPWDGCTDECEGG
ncbi:MAG: hypothetical protein AB7S26_34315 [Sandaracinaceae bacterium]